MLHHQNVELSSRKSKTWQPEVPTLIGLANPHPDTGSVHLSAPKSCLCSDINVLLNEGLDLRLQGERFGEMEENMADVPHKLILSTTGLRRNFGREIMDHLMPSFVVLGSDAGCIDSPAINFVMTLYRLLGGTAPSSLLFPLFPSLSHCSRLFLYCKSISVEVNFFPHPAYTKIFWNEAGDDFSWQELPSAVMANVLVTW